MAIVSTQTSVLPQIIVDGLIDEIQIDSLEANQVDWISNDQSGFIKVVFRGPNGYYIQVFDHRERSRKALNVRNYHLVFKCGGCRGRFAKKSGLYIALADIDDRSTDIGRYPDYPLVEGLVLTKLPIDKTKYRVYNSADGRAALHPDTGICFARRVIGK